MGAACRQAGVTGVPHALREAHDAPVPPDGPEGLEELLVPDLLYALLLIGGFALLVLTLRGLERL